MRKFIGRLCASTLIASLFLVLLRVFSEWPIDGKDADYATLEAGRYIVSFYKGGNGRISGVIIEGRKPSDQEDVYIFSGVSKKQRLQGVSCSQLAPSQEKDESCFGEDTVELRFLTVPLWHTAIVSASSKACYSEVLLVKAISSWHPVSYRRLCH